MMTALSKGALCSRRRIIMIVAAIGLLYLYVVALVYAIGVNAAQRVLSPRRLPSNDRFERS
jgi:hypothetical protein